MLIRKKSTGLFFWRDLKLKSIKSKAKIKRLVQNENSLESHNYPLLYTIFVLQLT